MLVDTYPWQMSNIITYNFEIEALHIYFLVICGKSGHSTNSANLMSRSLTAGLS